MSRQLDKLRKQVQNHLEQARDSTENRSCILQNMQKVNAEYFRVADVSRRAPAIIEDIDKQFKEKTKLSDTDIVFLFVATALQCARQYLLTSFPERLGHTESAETTLGHNKEHSNRSYRLYHPSCEQIISNPVPFDATTGSKNYGLNIGGGFNHRASTLGHDPVLGWIFGTMNILTGTLTTSDFQSFHVHTGYVNNGPRDIINQHASLGKIFSYSSNRLLNEGIDGKTAFGLALVKECIHLKSDINSKASLPLPFVSSMVSPSFAARLAKYGLDMSNTVAVTKQAAFAALTNSIVAMIHRLLYNENKDGSETMYEVRTRKILSYSNALSTGSNVIVTAVTRDISKLDTGGLLVALHRFISDYRFINEIKRDFLKNEIYNMILGNEYDFMEG